MSTNAFDADRCEVRAAVIVLLVAVVSILAGLSQARPGLVRVRSGTLPMIDSVACNIERR